MILVQNKTILASQSPRRIELLKLLVDEFDVVVSNAEEVMNEEISSEQLVMDLALLKAKEVSKQHPGRYVLGFDTIVVLDGKPLGKPVDRDDAFAMLKSLSNRSHQVVTGCAIVKDDYQELFYDGATVTFNLMMHSEINEYLDTGEPFDKAGAYGIQGYGARYISKVEGDYYSVMGMPIQELYKRLRRLK